VKAHVYALEAISLS